MATQDQSSPVRRVLKHTQVRAWVRELIPLTDLGPGAKIGPRKQDWIDIEKLCSTSLLELRLGSFYNEQQAIPTHAKGVGLGGAGAVYFSPYHVGRRYLLGPCPFLLRPASGDPGGVRDDGTAFLLMALKWVKGSLGSAGKESKSILAVALWSYVRVQRINFYNLFNGHRRHEPPWRINNPLRWKTYLASISRL